MAIQRGNHLEGPFEVTYDDEKIVILLSQSDHRDYLAVRGQKPAQGIIHGAVVLPVLADAIRTMRESASEYEDRNWFGRLETILQARDLEQLDPLRAAQKILDSPASRTLHGIEVLMNAPDDVSYE